MLLKDELYSIAEEVIQEKEELEKIKKIALHEKLVNNTPDIWEKYIKTAILREAKNGMFSYVFYFYRPIYADSYFCTVKDSAEYNKKLRLPYDFTIFKDGFFDIDTLITLIKENGLFYQLMDQEMAWSKCSKYKSTGSCLRLVISWKTELQDSLQKDTTKIIESYKERKKMTAGLRYDILHRDNFKCQICGRTAQEDNVKLHVDHIIPISKGGKTVPENLRTLCQDCNLGKGSKIE